jgi:hypothetical protein
MSLGECCRVLIEVVTDCGPHLREQPTGKESEDEVTISAGTVLSREGAGVMPGYLFQIIHVSPFEFPTRFNDWEMSLPVKKEETVVKAGGTCAQLLPRTL